MLVEDVRDDVVNSFILPNALVAAEFQEVHPGRETKLVRSQSAVRSQSSNRMYETVVGLVRLV